MKILLVEDDIFWQTTIEMFLEKLGFCELVHFNNLVDTETYLLSNTPDLLIVDVQIGEKTIFDYLEQQEDFTSPVIFVTIAENESYLRKSNTYVHSYFLIKPFHFITLLAAIENVMKDYYSIDHSTPAGITVKGKKNTPVLIPNQEIQYIQVKKNYCILNTAIGIFTLKTTLQNILNQLSNDFIQIHRSFAINKNAIISVNSIEKIVVTSKESFTYSQSYEQALEEFIQ